MSTAALRSILVATDLSEHSDEVVRTAAVLAMASDARLHVLHAFQFSDLKHEPDARVPAIFEGRVADRERALEQQVQRAAPHWRDRAAWQAVIRPPSKGILEQARSMAADLIVLGPHSAHPLRDSLLGSTADRVLKEAVVPCLLARGQLSFPLRKIVVADDLSGHSTCALEVALSWGLSFGARSEPGIPEIEIEVIHVIPGVFPMEEFPSASAVIGPERGRFVEEAVTRIEGAGQLDVREEVIWGDNPVEKIVQFSNAAGADLVVLGTRGRGAIQRILLGSVASAVARRASCPVLLIPRSMWQKRGEAADAGETLQSHTVP